MIITRCAGHLGAEITGVDLPRLAPNDAEELRSALREHRVLFFRDQPLDHDQHIAFAGVFGSPTRGHPLVDVAAHGYPQVLTSDYWRSEARFGITAAERRRDELSPLAGWHSDLTPLVNPPAACVLRAEAVPAFAGDTTWTSLVAAHETLSPRLQDFIGTLRAEHRYLSGYQPRGRDDDGYARQLAAKPLAAVHPLVRVHPETGERVLFVNPLFTARIVELSAHESQHVLRLLFEHLTQAAFTVRFRWAAGSVAVWDNRATAHLPAADLEGPCIEPKLRVMHRVSVEGDIPVDADGRPSEALLGEPWLAYAAP